MTRLANFIFHLRIYIENIYIFFYWKRYNSNTIFSVRDIYQVNFALPQMILSLLVNIKIQLLSKFVQIYKCIELNYSLFKHLCLPPWRCALFEWQWELHFTFAIEHRQLSMLEQKIIAAVRRLTVLLFHALTGTKPGKRPKLP